MREHYGSAFLTALTALMMASVTGCENLNNMQKGAALGGAGGAGLGAIIGNQVGHKGTGALIGGLTGGALGAAVGKAKDNAEERDMAVGYAAHQQASREADARAINNYDVIKMSKNHMSDETIINQIFSRGGRFDLSTDAVIALKDEGVSENVIQTMQRHGASQ